MLIAHNVKGKVMSNIQPIKPSEVVEKKKEFLPDEVIETFNELIASCWDGDCSKFEQEQAVMLIVEKMQISREMIFDLKYLDIEDIYRGMGWKVIYDRPSQNETYAPTFEFRKKK